MRHWDVDGRIVNDSRYSSLVKWLAQRGYYRWATFAQRCGL